MPKPPVSPTRLRKTMRELDESGRAQPSLAVGGPRELAAVLRRELARGAAPGAVRDTDAPEGAAVLVYVLGREPTEEDEQALRRAWKARVPIVAVVAGPAPADPTLPFVLASDVVRVGPGEGFPLDEIARAVAERLGEEAAPLAARVPALRGAVSEQIVRRFSRKNAIVAAVVFLPGADLPVLTLNQVRMLLRLGQVHGRRTSRDLLLEVGATVGAGLGFRTLARSLLDFVPVGGWAVKSVVAYTGTRALGEAALWRLSDQVDVDGAPGGHPPGP